MNLPGFITKTRLICTALIVLLLAGLYPYQGLLHKMQNEHDLAPPTIEGLPTGEFAGTILTGGFRAIAVDIIWLKALEAERNRDFHRVLVLQQLIAALQPRFVQVWIFNSWNMSYNLSITAPTHEEAWEWVKRGIDFGKEGSRRNPNNWEIAHTVGYHYYHKCGITPDERGEIFGQWLLEETGSTNFQHSLEWFKKAYEIARANDTGNPHRLSMVSTVYREMAFDAEEQGDLDVMVQYRMKAIEWLERIRTDYPRNESFQRYSVGEINDLGARLIAHRQQQVAAQHRAEGNFEAELELLATAGAYWMEAFRGNPYRSEQGRQLEKIANRMDEFVRFDIPELSEKAEFYRTEIWLRLMSHPNYFEEHVEAVQFLADQYEESLGNPLEAENERQMLLALSRVVRFRIALLDKEPDEPGRTEDVRRIADRIELIIEKRPELDPEALDAMARDVWFSLIHHGRHDDIEPGLQRLTAYAEKTLQRLGDSNEPEAEHIRHDVVELIKALQAHNLEPEWTDKHLREVGVYYFEQLEKAVEAIDGDAVMVFNRRADSVWRAVRQQTPDDEEAEHYLNRIAELYTIFINHIP